MKFNSSLLLITILTFFILSCGNDKKNESPEQIKEENNPVDFSADTIYISDTYPDFPSKEVVSILDSLHFCTLTIDKSIPDSLQLYPCSAELFGIFPTDLKQKYESNFLFEARQGVWAKSSRVFNLSKVDGIWLVTNDLKGQLLYMIPAENSNHTIVLRYYDSQIGTVAIEHHWKGKMYQPSNVVMLNDLPVKKEFQDSLNHIYIDNFIWGY
jgi:hypothetical protein